MKKYVLSILIIILLASCSKIQSVTNVRKDDMFTLSIGNMDEELDFFSRDGIAFSLKSDIFMKDGFFYIANGNGKKIMKFNSFGNLLKKISPARQSETAPKDDSSWSFNEPGNIAVSKDFTFIEDTVEYNLSFRDEYIDTTKDTTKDATDYESHILNNKIVSIFNENGDYINYIGQEGLGGKPFPFINNIFTDIKDRLIVITQTTFFWTVYRYTQTGEFIDSFEINLENNLPSLENSENTITQIDSIIPDRVNDRILVELTFYRKVLNENTGDIVSINQIKSRVYYYDLKTRSYISWMEIPKKNDYNGQNVLLDIVNGKYLYFISLGKDGLSQFLTITNENGYPIGEYNLNTDSANIIYSSFYVTPIDGIVTALLCTKYAGGISMWRTDKILEEDSK
ncbi:MAG: hypothetical protein B6229_00150 [Spirochaetaceae bacterium 4572_7]|nr:MAG: hypothetical protein B6229_00150 [Spirochaetaceae bacterium 4572_7]